MPPVSTQDLSHLAPFAPELEEAGEQYGVRPYLLGAICLTESGAGYAPGYTPQGDPAGYGDHGNGFGLMQIDRRYHSDFISTPEAQQPLYQFYFAASLLHQAEVYFTSLKRKYPLLVAGFDVAVICSYNAGTTHVTSALKVNQDPNVVTTHGDYAFRVQAKEAALRLLIPGLFSPLQVA